MNRPPGEKPPIGVPPGARPPIGAPPRRAAVVEEVVQQPARRPVAAEEHAAPPPGERPSQPQGERASQPQGERVSHTQVSPQTAQAAAPPLAPGAAPAMSQQQVEAIVKHLQTMYGHIQTANAQIQQLQQERAQFQQVKEQLQQAQGALQQVGELRAQLEQAQSRLEKIQSAPANVAVAQAPAGVPAAQAQAPAAAQAPAGEAPVVKPQLPTHAPGIPGKNKIDRFLKLMRDRGASDLHLSVGRPPIFRLSGRIEPIRYRTLDDADFTQLIEPIAQMHLWHEFKESGDMDFAYEVPGLSRFRVNLFRQERGMGAVFRIIPTKLMTVEQLGLPQQVRKVVEYRSGLVLVTGPTGSGKSTTLSAIINEMNEKRPMHFVTIEDPIEFVHPNKKSLMTQREVGPHSKSFSTALRAAVREDPDAVLVGEMRDLETISMALNAAETGVLVFGTLHTNCAAKTLDRIINVFPADKQPGVRGTLASVTKCIVAQQLLRKKAGGRVAAIEILFGSNAMASMIRDGKTHQISGLIKLGKRDGMIAMDDALKKLVEDEVIEPLAGLEKSLDKDEFRKWLRERGTDVPDEESAKH